MSRPSFRFFRHLARNRSLGVIALGVLVTAGLVIWFKMVAPTLSDAAWYDDNYLYRQAITITHNASITTDRRISISVDTATLITNNKMQSDCDDTRFSDINGKVLRYQLTGTCNNAATTYDVVFPTIINGTTGGFIYYGNQSAISGSQDVSATTSLTPSGGAPTVASEQQAITPIVYYKFDEGTGTTANDSANGGFSGTLTGSLTYQTEDQCISGKCLLFNGSSQYTSTANDAKLTPAAMTLGMWVRPIALPTSGNIAGLVDKRDNTAFSAGYQLQLVNDSGTQKLRFYMGGTYLDVAYTLPLDQWTYITVTLNGTTATMYINGNAQTSQATGSLTNYATALLIGKNSTNNYYNGFIDEFKIYNYSRSAAQIKTDFTARSSRDGTSTLTSYTPNNDPAALNNGLVGYWKMDQTSWNGTAGEAVDSSGNANNGTAVNGATTGVGKFSNGGAFDGTNDYVSVASSSSVSISGSLTISTWVNLTSNKDYNQLINKGSDPSGTENYEIYVPVNGIPSGEWKFASGRSNCTNGGTTALTTGTWNHIVVVYDATAQKCKTYINGTLAGTVTSGVGSSLVTNSTAIELGGDTTVAGRYLNGKLDETRIYNRALSDTDVANLANFAPGPAAYWAMEEGTGTTTADTSSNGNTGTLTSGPTWSTGKYGKGISLDGSNDYVTVPSNSAFSISTSLTISAWVYLNSNKNYNQVLNKGDDVTGTENYEIYIPSSGIPSGEWKFASGRSNCTNGGTTALSTGTWNYIVVAYDSVAQSCKTYINGVLAGTVTASVGTSLVTNSTALQIGGDTTVAGRYLDGKVDEVKIYNYARTAGQVVQDMNASHPSGGSPVASQIAYWKFDEGQGTTANNSGTGGTSFNGTLNTFASPATSTSGWTNNGKFNKALNFDGSDDYIAVGAAKFDAMSSGSISGWIKFGATGSNDNNIFSHVVDSNNRVQLFVRDTTDKLLFEVCVSGTCGASDRLTSNASIVNGAWTHVVVTFGPSGEKMYINGKLDVSNTSTASFASIGTSTTNSIGQLSVFGGTFFTGMIDELKIYGGELSASQVLVDYNRGSAQVLGAGGTGDVPPTISNLGLWLDANDASTVTIATGVSAWADKSGNARNMAQATGSKQPAYTLGILNGKPVLRFTAASSQTMTNATNFAAPVTVSYVVRQTGGTNGRVLTAVSNNWLLGYWNGGKQQAYFEGWVSAVGTPATDTSWYIYSVIQTGALSTVYENGTQIFSNASGVTGPNGLSLVGYQGTSEFSNADIAEVVVYSRALTLAELQKVEGYFASKWGLQSNLLSTSPYKNTPPAVSSFSTGSTYCPPGDNCAPPMLEYLFEEGSGTSARDTSGNGYTGTLNNSPTYVPGVHGKALKFNGSNQNVTVASWGNNAPRTDITISFWVKSANYDATGRNVMWLGADTPDRINIHFPWSNGNIYWDFGTCCTPRLTYTPTGWVDTWTHFEVVHSNTGGFMRIYQNGVLQSSGTNVGTFVPGNYTLYVGSGSATAYLNGALDDFRIYPYARTAAEVAWDYNNGKPVAQWKMDECQGTTINDSSGNSLTGTLTVGASGTQTAAGNCNTSSAAAAWYNGRTGKLNYSLNLDGTDDYVSITDGAALKPTAGVTQSAWVYPTSISGNRNIFSLGAGTTFPNCNDYGQPYQLRTNTGTGKPEVVIWVSGTGFQTVTANTALATNTWSHVAATYNAGTVNIYINGRLDKSGTTTSTALAYPLAAYTPTIGASKGGNGSICITDSYFAGQIDDVRVYNYALTQPQIQTLLNSGPVRYGPSTGAP